MNQTDKRPTNCRFRLAEEGKPYPRSGCDACGRTITTGLGASCQELHLPEPQTDKHGWRDISSAPKDGSDFLAFARWREQDCSFVAFYSVVCFEPSEEGSDYCWRDGDEARHKSVYSYWLPFDDLPLPPPPEEEA